MSQSVATPVASPSPWLVPGAKLRPAPSPFHRVFGPPRSIKRSQWALGLTLFLPVMLGFVIIRVVPIAMILGLSVTDAGLPGQPFEWTGLDNFQRLLGDDLALESLKHSAQFVVLGVPLELIMGMTFALLLSRRVKWEALFLTLFFLPYILPMVPSTIIWKWIYTPGPSGVANTLLAMVGLPRVPWLTNPNVAINAIIFFHVWKQLGFFVVVFLVGLKAIPREFLEAAEVDGANLLQRLRYIELPLMRPTILFGVVMGTIWAWSVFTEVYVMTQGTDIAAGTDVQVIVTRIYQEGFLYFALGYASAISIVLFVLSLLFVLLQFWLLRGTGTEGNTTEAA
jgi:multiple sugar transport system permease protein